MSRRDELLLVEKRCAVTAFDMKIQLNKDGRERGLWIFLDDKSAIRRDMYNSWLDSALETFVLLMGYDVDPEKKQNLERFRASMSLNSELRNLLSTEVHEGPSSNGLRLSACTTRWARRSRRLASVATSPRRPERSASRE